MGAAQNRHSPTLETVIMVEKMIRECDTPPTRTELWDSLPRRVMYQTFKLILEYLDASGKIVFNDDRVVWVAFDNPKLDAFFKRSRKLA